MIMVHQKEEMQMILKSVNLLCVHQEGQFRIDSNVAATSGGHPFLTPLLCQAQKSPIKPVPLSIR